MTLPRLQPRRPGSSVAPRAARGTKGPSQPKLDRSVSSRPSHPGRFGALAVSLAFSGLLAWPLSARADELFVLTTDYSTGSSSTMALASPWNTQLDVESVGSDPVARYFSGSIYVINRLGGDNLQVVDASNYQTIHQFSLGAGSNPQDIAVLSENRAYVSRYNDTLLEIDPTTGTILDQISLDPLADGDGFPEASRLHFRAPYLYVQIQRLDRSQFYEPTGISYLGVIDTRDNTLVDVDPSEPGTQGIALQATNPTGPMQIDLTSNRSLLVGCAGSFFDQTDGGLEAVDLESWASEGLRVTGAALGGDIGSFAQYDGRIGYAIVSDASFVTCLKQVDFAAGTVLSDAYCSEGFDLIHCVTAPEGWLYLADRNFVDPGIRVFDAESGMPLSSGVVTVGLPPVEIHVVRPETSSAPWPDPVFTRSVFPNPSGGGVRWGLARTANSTPLLVVDALGRTVRELEPGATSWDGTDAQGRSAPSGAYWLHATAQHRKGTLGFRLTR